MTFRYSIGKIEIEKHARKTLSKLIRDHNHFVDKGKSHETDKIRPNIVKMIGQYNLKVSGCGCIHAPQ
jgi:hypothetical protein